jgi:uncharacterized protein (TIGR02611 family)
MGRMSAAPRDPNDRYGRRRGPWGDEPEERDAAEFFAGLEADRPELARRWHDHPAVVPFKVVARFIRRSGKRIAVTIAGFAVLLAGVAMLVLPGPGVLVIIGGLAILATEYVWAQRLLATAKEKASQAKDAVLGKKDTSSDDGTSS